MISERSILTNENLFQIQHVISQQRLAAVEEGEREK